MSSKFAVGDMVAYTGPYLRFPIQCTVIKVMPEVHEITSYHIKDAHELFERSVPETSLTRVI
jgi:hypothetical protein